MSSQGAKHPGLGSEYEGLSGQELLGKLAEDGRVATLEAFWRYGDSAVRTRGQTSLRVIVTSDGRIINAFPVKVQ